MKNIYILFFALVVFGLHAQPVFQYTNMPNPTSGMTATVLIGNKPASPGPSGAGVTWNFSSLSFTPAGTASVVLPSSTPYAASFTAATTAAMIALSTATFYTYDNVQPTFKDQLGDGITATGGSTYTPNPKRHLIFPFSYGNSYSDSYQCVSCSPGSFTVTYDGWGTLIINGKTYNNVARVSNLFGFPYYNFYNTNPVFPIFSYDTSPTSGTTSILAESSVFTGIQENYVIENMLVYPNPAGNYFTIQNNNFMKVSFAIIDVLGKEVKPLQLINQGEAVKVDVSDQKSGIYFIRYYDEFGNNSYSKLIKE